MLNDVKIDEARGRREALEELRAKLTAELKGAPHNAPDGTQFTYMGGLARARRIVEEAFRFELEAEETLVLAAAAAEEDAPPAGRPPQEPAVSWDDLAEGVVIRYQHITRQGRLAGRAPQVRRGRIVLANRPRAGKNAAYISLHVLNNDGTVNQKIRSHSLFGLDFILGVESTPEQQS